MRTIRSGRNMSLPDRSSSCTRETTRRPTRLRPCSTPSSVLQDDPRLLMLSVGGGEGKRTSRTESAGARGTFDLFPTSRLERIRFSLSAADAHVVSIGDAVVGIVHPCKVYGAMAVARPILAVGPRASHVSDLVDSLGIGKSVAHGDVDAAVAAIRSLLDSDTDKRKAMGRRARAAIDGGLGRRALLGRFLRRATERLARTWLMRSPAGRPSVPGNELPDSLLHGIAVPDRRSEASPKDRNGTRRACFLHETS